MTRDNVIRLLAFFSEAYPNTRLPAAPNDRIDVWHAVLRDEPDEAMFAAAHKIAQSDEFHPTPARCISVMVTGDTSSGMLARIRVRHYLDERDSLRRISG